MLQFNAALKEKCSCVSSLNTSNGYVLHDNQTNLFFNISPRTSGKKEKHFSMRRHALLVLLLCVPCLSESSEGDFQSDLHEGESILEIIILSISIALLGCGKPFIWTVLSRDWM